MQCDFSFATARPQTYQGYVRACGTTSKNINARYNINAVIMQPLVWPPRKIMSLWSFQLNVEPSMNPLLIPISHAWGSSNFSYFLCFFLAYRSLTQSTHQSYSIFSLSAAYKNA